MLRRILTAIGYFALAAAVVLVTIGLVAYGRGLRYDLATHSIIDTGIVVIQSSPGSATVSLDGRKLKKKTTYRATFKAGTSHAFTLTKDGYYDWSKTLPVIASEVTLADYVILVPKKPTITTLDSRSQIIAQSMSADHRHLAYITGGADSALYTLDLGNPKPVRLYTPKVATDTTAAETLDAVTWSDDASHLLIASHEGATVISRLAAASGGEPTNLTQQYGFDFTGLQFSGDNWQQLYWISPDGLRRLDVSSQSVSGVLATQVSQIKVTPDRVLYVATTDLGRSLLSIDSRNRKQQLIPALPESDSYAIDYTNYRGTDELAVVPSKTQIGTLYTDIFGSNPIAKTLVQNAAGASFSPDGHLLAFTSPTSIQTYDLDRSNILTQPVLYVFPPNAAPITSFSWFDNYHLLLSRGGKMVWTEYDGANSLELGDSNGLTPYGTSDFKSIVWFQPAGDATRVSQLIVKP